MQCLCTVQHQTVTSRLPVIVLPFLLDLTYVADTRGAALTAAANDSGRCDLPSWTLVWWLFSFLLLFCIPSWKKINMVKKVLPFVTSGKFAVGPQVVLNAKFSLAWSNKEYYYSLDGILVHHRVTSPPPPLHFMFPWQLTSTHLYIWVERDNVEQIC